MSASMAEVVASHYPAYKWDRDFAENVWICTNLECNFGSDHFEKAMEHVAEQLAANGYGKLEDAKAPEVRYATLTDGETELDEIVARNASVHLEAMDSNHWWMAIESGGTRYAVNLYTKRAKITAHAEED